MTAPRSGQAQGCIFCIAYASDDPRSTLTLYRNRQAIVMLNRYPYSNGHLLVAPEAHQARLFESTDASLRALIRLTAEAQRILSDVYHPDGFNVGMNFGQVAGAGIADHYHMHIVPRWSGDANFMT
ncbi:MAG: HIT domain-containing protein, partial [Nitrospirota bacterium]